MLVAVHIADGVLTGPLQVFGWCGLVLLVFLGAWRLRDEEVPSIAILSAAFFVSSLIHLRLPTGSVHLLLNPVVGMVLGLRAGLAIPLGLLLQALLFYHGGLVALGVNAVIMTCPALLGRAALLTGARLGWLKQVRQRVALGMAIGFLVVLVTLVLHFITLALGSIAGQDLWRLAAFDFMLHLPVLFIEAFITGIALDFLWRVKPVVLRLPGQNGSV